MRSNPQWSSKLWTGAELRTMAIRGNIEDLFSPPSSLRPKFMVQIQSCRLGNLRWWLRAEARVVLGTKSREDPKLFLSRSQIVISR